MPSMAMYSMVKIQKYAIQWSRFAFPFFLWSAW